MVFPNKKMQKKMVDISIYRDLSYPAEFCRRILRQ
jgi:hypothetical protein